MRCYDCDFYNSGYMWNYCGLTESECFRTQDNCTLVNDDQSINKTEIDKMFGNDDQVLTTNACPLDLTRPENYPCSRGDCDCDICKDTQGKEE